MAMACGRPRPDMTSSSSALSKAAESLPPGWMMGKSFLMSSPKSGEARIGLARVHPVDVAAHGVDLAVVRDVAVGVRQLPGGKRVGGEALVHQAERADHFGIAAARGRSWRSAARAAVLYRRWCARRATECRRSLFSGMSRLGDFGFGALADDVELALELVLGHALAAARRRSARCRAARRAPRGRWRRHRWACRASRGR